MYKRSADFQGFTLIELTVVILTIAILMGLVFTAGQGAFDRARKTQAKNDVTQIVTAINAFYTEYGHNPINTTFTADAEYGNPDGPIFPNSHVMNALRAIARSGEPNANDALNPRKIVFLQGVLVKDTSHPRGGFDSNGEFWDPWGSPSDGTDTKGHYIVILDGDYNNYTQVYTLNYSDLTYQSVNGGNAVQASAVAARLGKDRSYGKLPSGGTAPTGDYKYKGSDDVLSWQ